MTITKATISSMDYVVIAVMLLIALTIGMYYAWKDRTGNLADYFFGSKSLHPIPLGLSISLTFASAYSVIGLATQAYLFGTVMVWMVVACAVSQTVAHCYYIPLIRRTKLTSIYEYLEKRFHSKIRKIASFLSITNMILFMGINIYVPSMAMSAVSNLDLTISLIITATVCTVYTALGGIKAVVWTDTVQAGVMALGQLVICIVGVNKVGVSETIYESFYNGEKNTFLNFDTNIQEYYTFWTICVGMSVALSGASCADQSTLTRYLACRTTKDARRANLVAFFPTALIVLSSIFSGSIMYAVFEKCSPLLTGEVDKVDQLLPLLAIQLFSSTPGFTGLFISGLYSGALSTVSSGLNALSMLVLEDWINPKLTKKFLRSPDNNRLVFSKFIVFLFGFLILGCSMMLARYSKSNFVEVFMSLSGVIVGPVLGLFTLGVFVPWANAKGALVGQMSATFLGLWMAIGSMMYPHRPSPAGPMFTNCSEPITVVAPYQYEGNATLPATLYRVNPFSYGMISVFTVVCIGTMVSLITKKNDPSEMDPRMFVPLINFNFLPNSINSFFRFGVPPLKIDDEDEDESKKLPSMYDSDSLVGLKLESFGSEETTDSNEGIVCKV